MRTTLIAGYDSGQAFNHILISFAGVKEIEITLLPRSKYKRSPRFLIYKINPMRLKQTSYLSLVSSRFLLALGVIAMLGACKKEYITEQTIVEPPIVEEDARFTKFWLATGHNTAFLHDSIEFDISGTNIIGRVPYYSTIDSLIPSFEADSATVTINGVAQQSGVTSQNFRNELVYTVAGKNGKSTNYNVKLLNFTGLPVVRIHTSGRAPITSKEVYVNATMRFDGAGEYPDIETPIEIRGRGNSTWTLPKKPYKVKPGNKQAFFGGEAHKDWALLANYTDKTQLRNATAFFMGQISNLDWTPKAQFVEVFINDHYQGTYQLTETIDVGESRINITDDGFLLEVDQPSRMTPEDVYFTTNRFLFNIKEPGVAKDDAQYNYIKNYVLEAENALLGPQFADPAEGYEKYLDVESFVDWFLVNEIAKNNDAAFVSSCYMHKAPESKLKMGPIWDFDIAFSNVNYSDARLSAGWWVKTTPWYARLFEDPKFVQKVKERFAFFKSQQNKILEFVNANATKLKWSAIENNNRWKTLYTETWPNYAIWGSYDNEVMYMKNWINARMSWLEGAINAL